MARVRRSRRVRKTLPEITLTPLIDTALTLLIIFMIATPMIQNALKIELPRGKMKEAGSNQQELMVAVSKEGKVALDGKIISFDTLPESVRKKIRSRKNQTVFVKADRASNYGEVIRIVDALKQIEGVSYVALATAGHAS